MLMTMSISRTPSSIACFAWNALVGVASAPCGKLSTHDTMTGEPASSSAASFTSHGRTHMLATPRSMHIRALSRTSCSVWSGLSTAWSIFDATS